jgi:uncharacterized membrane protein YcaP (DUF421 family)
MTASCVATWTAQSRAWIALISVPRHCFEIAFTDAQHHLRDKPDTGVADGEVAMQSAIDGLFSLSMPWWEFVLRAVIVYVVVLALMRLTGKRTVGQLTPFDLLVVVLLGNAVQNSLIGEDSSLLGGLILAATLLGLNSLVGLLSARSRRFDRFIEGSPVILARHGKVFREQLTHQAISERDFAIARRAAGYATLGEIELAVLETSGEITFIRRKDGPHAPG